MGQPQSAMHHKQLSISMWNNLRRIFAAAYAAVKALATFVIGFSVLLIAAYAIREMMKSDTVIVEPFSVPKAFEESGLTPNAMATRIADALAKLENSTLTTASSRDDVRLASALGSIDKIEVPGTNLGLGTVIDTMRTLLGRSARHVGGGIVVPVSGTNDSSNGRFRAAVTVYVSDGVARSSITSVSAVPETVDELARRAAEAALRYLNPLLLAASLEQHGENDQAIDLVERAVDDLHIDRGRREKALLLWGLGLSHEKRYDEAAAKFREAIELNPRGALDPGSAVADVDWGISLAAQNKNDEAIQKYRDALSVNPSFAYAYNAWGLALAAQGKVDEAEQKYRRAIDTSNRKLAFAYHNLGLLLLEHRRDYPSAADQFRRAVMLNPNQAASFVYWGRALAMSQRYEEAIAKYQRVADIDPAYTGHYTLWADALARMRRYNDALAKYRQAIQSRSDDPAPYNGAGRLYLSVRKDDCAIDAFQSALVSAPTLADTHANLGMVLAAQGKYAAALVELETAVELNSQSAYSLSRLAEILTAHGEPGKAVPMFERAHQLDESDAFTYARWGAALAALGKVDDAVSKYKEAIKWDSMDAFAYREWGDLLAAQRKYGEAASLFQHAIDADPTDGSTYEKWAAMLRQQNKKDEATGKSVAAKQLQAAKFPTLTCLH